MAVRTRLPHTPRGSSAQAPRPDRPAPDGPGKRVRRTSIAARAHAYEKVGAHRARTRRTGSSDLRSAVGTGQRSVPETVAAVAFLGHTKAELLDLARRYGVRGRSRMSKTELARALGRAR
jgi:hypothetical protein